MNATRLAIGMLTAAGLFAGGCSSTTKSGGCEPGSRKDCLGDERCVGQSVCAEDGKWEECTCGGEGGGGAGAPSGATGGERNEGSGGAATTGGVGADGGSISASGGRSSGDAGAAGAPTDGGAATGGIASDRGGSDGTGGASGIAGSLPVGGAGGRTDAGGRGGAVGLAGSGTGGDDSGGVGPGGAGIGGDGTAGAGGATRTAISTHPTLAEGLRAYWTFDAAPDEAFRDATGNNADGQILGATEAAGKIGGAYYFGGDSSILVPDGDALSFTDGAGTDAPFSVSVWVSVTNTDQARVVLAKCTDAGESEWSVSYYNYLHLACHDSGGNSLIATTETNSTTPGNWQHVAITYDGSESAAGVLFYLDGDLMPSDGAHAQYVGMSNTAHPLHIGRLGAHDANQFLGTMDELGIWGRVLSQDEVAALYNDGAGIPY